MLSSNGLFTGGGRGSGSWPWGGLGLPLPRLLLFTRAKCGLLNGKWKWGVQAIAESGVMVPMSVKVGEKACPAKLREEEEGRESEHPDPGRAMTPGGPGPHALRKKERKKEREREREATWRGGPAQAPIKKRRRHRGRERQRKAETTAQYALPSTRSQPNQGCTEVSLSASARRSRLQIKGSDRSFRQHQALRESSRRGHQSMHPKTCEWSRGDRPRNGKRRIPGRREVHKSKHEQIEQPPIIGAANIAAGNGNLNEP